MSTISSNPTRQLPSPQGMKPLFKKDETPTIQDSVFFRRGDGVGSDDWSCHMERFKGIREPDHPDYMPRTEGFLAAAAAMGAGAATTLVSLPYSLSVIGPVVVGTGLWASGNSDQGLLGTVGEHLTLPFNGASKVADVVFEKVAGSFYEGEGPTLTLHQDNDGLTWGIPNQDR